jgi:tungstate transport system ATP-binding protein
MLKIENIKKTYGSIHVLDIQSWEVADGESVALLGANATGKTTLLEIIAGLIPATSGKVLYDAALVTRPISEIGIVLQNPVMFAASVSGNVAFGINRNGLSRDEKSAKIRDALSMVGLEGFERRDARKLSEGQKQRVAIARALALDPKLLLLDEPSASVDRESAAHIAGILADLNEKNGMALIVATHDLDFARRTAKRTDILRNGNPMPYISGNIFTGAARIENEETTITIGDGTTIVAGGKYSGSVDVAIPPENIVVSNDTLHSSMRNSIRGRVTSLKAEENRVEVIIDIGVPLVALLTKSALNELGITVGDTVHASFKAHGIIISPRSPGGEG